MNILILENNPADAACISASITKALRGSTVKVTACKKDFIDALEHFSPDIVLADHFTPGFDAEAALNDVVARRPEAAFIILSSAMSDEVILKILKKGAVDYISKENTVRLIPAITAAVKQRQTELAKHELEAQFQITMERVSDAFISLDRNWNYAYVNKQAGELLRWKSEELTGKNIWENFPEATEREFFNACHTALREQVYIRMEEYYPPLEIWMENHIYPSENGLSIFFRDITERKIAEEKILLSDRNMKAIFDNSSEGFVLMDRDRRIRMFNKVAGMMGYENNEIQLATGDDLLADITPDRRNLFSKSFETVLSGKSVQYDHSYRNGDITRWFNFTLNPVYEAGTITGVCLTGKDITERKSVEAQRMFDHNNLHALINTTLDPMWSVDTDFRLITFNEAFGLLIMHLNGTTAISGDNLLDLAFNPAERKRYKDFYERAFSGEVFTETFHTSEPADVWLEISFYPIWKKNRIAGTACFSRNLTQRKKTELRLLHLQETIQEQKLEQQRIVTRAILQAQEKERNHIGLELHDNVNQILAGAGLNISTLIHESGANEYLNRTLEYLKLAIDENRKIAHQYATPELTGNFIVSLKKLTHDMLDIRCNVETDFEHFDEHLIEENLKLNLYRVLQEHCTNIIKYAAADNVQVQGKTENGELHLLIMDDGRGMDTGQQSDGIGLKNIKGRVSAFKGKTTITSSPGNGFVLKIIIPLDAE